MNQAKDLKKTSYKTSKPRTWKTELKNTIAFYEKILQRSNGRYTTIKKSVSEQNKSVFKDSPIVDRKTSPSEQLEQRKSKFSVELTREELDALNNLLREVHSEEMHEVVYAPPVFDFFDFEAEFDPEMLWEDTNLDEYKEFLAEDVIEKLKTIQKNQKNNETEELVVSEEDFEENEFFSVEDYEEDSYVSTEDYEEELNISHEDYEELQISEEDYDDEIKISEDDYQEQE